VPEIESIREQIYQFILSNNPAAAAAVATGKLPPTATPEVEIKVNGDTVES
jgi:hypothetical protein